MVPHLLPLVPSAGCWLHSELTSAHIPVSAGDWLPLALQRQSGTSDVTWAPLAADTMEDHGDSDRMSSPYL